MWNVGAKDLEFIENGNKIVPGAGSNLGIEKNWEVCIIPVQK